MTEIKNKIGVTPNKELNLKLKEFGINDLWVELTFNGKNYVGCIIENEEPEVEE